MKDIYIKLCLLIIFQPKNDKKKNKNKDKKFQKEIRVIYTR